METRSLTQTKYIAKLCNCQVTLQIKVENIRNKGYIMQNDVIAKIIQKEIEKSSKG